MIKKSRRPTQADVDSLDALIVETKCDRAKLFLIVGVEDASEMTALQCEEAIYLLKERKWSIANKGTPRPPRRFSATDTVEMTVARLDKLVHGAHEDGKAEGKAEATIGDLDEWEEWAPVLKEFRTNPKNTEPDFKALARLLRSDKPLPSTIRLELASLLEGRISGAVVGPRDNWQLRPVYSGQHAAHLRDRMKERPVEAAVKAAPTVGVAMADVEESGAMCERTAWDVWKRLKRKQAYARMLTNKYPRLAETPGLVNTMLDRIKAIPSQEAPLDETIQHEVRLELKKIIIEVRASSRA